MPTAICSGASLHETVLEQRLFMCAELAGGNAELLGKALLAPIENRFFLGVNPGVGFGAADQSGENIGQPWA